MSGLSSLLVRDQIVGVRRIEEALQRQVIHGGDLETNLLELAAVHEDVLAQYRAQVEGLLAVTAWEVMNPDEAACRLLPAELAERHRMLPLRIEGSTLLVAVAASPPTTALDELSFLLSLDVVPRITTEMRLAVALARVYGAALPPRLGRLADRVGPVSPASVVASQVVPVARTEAARRSALPPLPPTPATMAPSRTGPAAPLERVPRLAPTPPPPELVSPPAAPPSTAAAPSTTLTSLADADLDTRDTTETPAPFLLATPPAPPAPAPAPRAPEPPAPEPATGPEPVEDESLAARVMALVGDKRTEPAPAPAPAPAPEPAFAVESSSRVRGDETERVFIEPRGEPPPARRRPALTPGVAAELLAETTSRDEVLELFLQVAHQAFEYVAIFVVQEAAADGRLAVGPGAPTDALRRLSVSLREDGLFTTVRDSASHYLGPVHDEGGNLRLLRDLGRPQPATVLVLPVLVRARVVLLLYADNGRRPSTPEDIGVLLATAPRVGAALERLIVARKFAGYASGERGMRAERSSVDKAAPELAGKRTRPATPLPPLASSPSPGASTPGRVPAGPTLPPLEPAERVLPMPPAQPLADASPRPGSLQSALFPPPPTLGAARAASPEDRWAAPTPRPPAAAPLTVPPTPVPPIAPPPPPPLAPMPSKQPTQRMGAPPPMPPPEPPAAGGQTLQVAVPPPATLTPTAPMPVEITEALERAQRAPTPATDAEPDVSVEPWQAPPDLDADTDVDVDESELEDEGSRRVALRDTMPAPPPRPVQPPELGPVSGATTGKRRSLPEAYRVDVVSLPPDMPRAEPSIIVDMGPNVEALVASLLRGGEEGDLAAAALQKVGEVALPALIQRFPGPLLFDRHAQHTRLPRVSDCGPLLRILPTFRKVVVPYLLPLLASRDPEVRFYATFLFSEIQYPEAIPKLSPLLFDADLQTRILAIDVLKGFRRFEEFEAVTKELREMAWIASNPPPRRRAAVEAIGELRDAGAVAMLIEMVDVADAELSDLCWKALVLITRQDFGKAKKKWQVWLAKEGARHHIEWLIDALVHPSPELRLGASEELKRITKEYFGYYYNLPKRDREKARKRYLEWWERIGRARFTGRPG